MPVVRIRALPQPGVDVRAVAIAVATALAAELRKDPRGSWVTWETVDAYAEGGHARPPSSRTTRTRGLRQSSRAAARRTSSPRCSAA